VYVQVRDYLQVRFPGVEVVGFNYPPPASKRAMSQIVSYTQIGTLALAFLGDQILPVVGANTNAAWYQKFKQNRVMIGVSTWFLGNTVSQSLISTGAFEIGFNGRLVFSKLKTGRLPSEKEILDGILNADPEQLIPPEEEEREPIFTTSAADSADDNKYDGSY